MNKVRLIKIISTIVFLVIGLIVGIIYLYLDNWNLIEFITNPTTMLMLLCLTTLGIVIWSLKE